MPLNPTTIGSEVDKEVKDVDEVEPKVPSEIEDTVEEDEDDDEFEDDDDEEDEDEDDGGVTD